MKACQAVKGYEKKVFHFKHPSYLQLKFSCNFWNFEFIPNSFSHMCLPTSLTFLTISSFEIILLSLCYLLQCKRIVFEYGPMILLNAEHLLESNDICTILHACNSPKAEWALAVKKIEHMSRMVWTLWPKFADENQLDDDVSSFCMYICHQKKILSLQIVNYGSDIKFVNCKLCFSVIQIIYYYLQLIFFLQKLRQDYESFSFVLEFDM